MTSGMRSLAGAFLVLLQATALVAQDTTAAPPIRPFGLRLGMPMAELRHSVPSMHPVQGTQAFETATVPRPHSDFESYIILATARQGLCKVVGIGKSTMNDAYGEQLRSIFDRLVAALTEKYGEPQRLDNLRAGSIWNEPRDWMMSLRQNERTLFVLWPQQGQDSVGPGVRGVVLEARATSSNSGYVRLTYEGMNFRACQTELQSSDKDAL